MAYPSRRSFQSSEEDSRLTSPPSPGYPPLSPPRPFFLAGRAASDRTSLDDAGSDSDREPSTPPSPAASGPPGAARSRNHRRRSQMQTTAYAPAPVDDDSPPPGNARDPFANQDLGWSPSSLYQDQAATRLSRDDSAQRREAARPPPSSYPFPFQAYPGNPDPGLPIPGLSRRSSLESVGRPRPSSAGANPLALDPPLSATGTTYPPAAASAHGYGMLAQRSPSASDLAHDPRARDSQDLARPFAPFMGAGGASPDPSSAPHSRRSSIHEHAPPVYRNSAAGALSSSAGLASASGHELPRSASVQTFRAPFLSPASRPSSTFWAPPSFPYAGSPGASAVALSVAKAPPPKPSTRLVNKLTKDEKPWIGAKDTRGRVSWWLTFALILAGTGVGGLLCYRAYAHVERLLPSQLCLVMSDEFDGGLDTTNNWNQISELGGFGNGEFEMTTSDSGNVYTQDGQLYILPTLTSDEIGEDSVFDGYQYTLPGCTSDNSSACSVTSSAGSKTVVNPVKSGRITTQGKQTIGYGKVEVRAKLPVGDWLWPAIWMMPEDATYGDWPQSGEIDIMEARGNGPQYSAQGNNVARSSLNYGPLPGVQARILGWQSFKRQTLAQGFHTYALEWTDKWMRFYVDTRLSAMLHIDGIGAYSFFDRGGFPKTFKNGSGDVVVENIWQDAGNSAPFNQQFYLIIDLAAGGTSGWFPDGVGNKSWYDGSFTAMYDFANAQSTWSQTWPQNADDRAFRIESVKMWSLC